MNFFSAASLTFASLLMIVHGSDKPNFLILYADDLGIGDVGCFGNDTLRTPHIDNICRKGVKLSHHLAAAATCTPSRAALLTGRYAVRSGLSSNNDIPIIISPASYAGLPQNETTFPKLLQQNGYKTGLVGKWHLGVHCERNGDYCHHPTKHGFDYFFGTPISNHRGLGSDGDNVVWHRYPRLPYILVTTGLCGLLGALFTTKKMGIVAGLLVGVLFGLIPLWGWFTIENSHIFSSGFWRNEELVEQPILFDRMSQRLVNEGVQFLRQRQEDGSPFLLMMSWLQVHTALHASAPFRGRSKHGPYGDEVEELDWSVGEMLSALTRLGLEHNTVVYFSSDNGGHIEEVDLKGNRLGGHNGIYRGSKFQGGQEGGTRMPSAILWPGQTVPGLDVVEPTSQMDLFATFLGAAGASLPKDRVIDGKNILPLLKGEKERSPHEFLFHYCGTEIHSMRFIPRTGTDVFKLHLYWPLWDEGTMGCFERFACACYSDHKKLEHVKLFNIAKDPSETSELDINSKLYAQITKTMLRGMEEHIRTVDPVPNQFDQYYAFYRPWLQHCCNFPFFNCRDNKNALYLSGK